ncbi:radical SAM protein [Helicobacter saguini]|uniref:Radical SAM protein n=1 Tax=Helicobacter saguini TaxID=1548018 RepID=A0A347VP66_9HELI|nr:radical SAM/SPASM domain-containing protein [Helicobacter saguini]MWV61493.1 radical SAM protein [Helicobacter saguini]MWV67836.1 radical SAM protein [Helicobacter saguini]MWV70696.1 radical SAM protein [Helicobacter saguini]MWV72600.1 radical SAM protein [Helicobacter saguini]TLD94590.1 radical SAM protein [Helicobacter saguini]
MKFYKIYLEISDICHLKCSFCPPKKAVRGVMDLALFDSITTQIKNHVNLLALHVLGDPLCVPNLSAFLDILESKNIRVDIVSSGANLSDFHFKELARQNVHQVSFSLDSAFDNGLDFETYFSQILRFYEFLQTCPYKIYVNLRLFGNYDITPILSHFRDFESQETKRRIRLNKHFFLRFHNEFKWIKSSKNNNFMESSFVNFAKSDLDSKNSKIHNLDSNLKPYCLGSISQLGILSNGLVVPCCLDSKGFMTLGDLKTQSFSEVIESRTFKSFQNAQKTHKNLSQICKTCTFRGV